MLTCRNGLGIYVSCHGKRLTVYRSVLLHNDSLWISSYYFSYSAITYRRDKVTPLRKENTFVTLLRNSRFRRIWFSRFLWTTTCGPSGAIHAAMIQSLMPLIALLLQWITKINAHKTIHSFVCLLHYSVLCLSFQKEIFTYYLACQPSLNKYTYAVRRYLLGHLYKRWC